MALSDSTLQRHPSLDDRLDPAIRIVAHDSRWAVAARDEILRIGVALGELAGAIEHVGSTAVPGLAAKPVIDIQLAVADVSRRPSFIAPLQRLGYQFIADPASPDYHFFARPSVRPRSHHLHVCEAGGSHELRHLAVRDFLRTHGCEAATYEALKRRLVAEHPEDRLAYIAGKGQYMDGLETRALLWASGRPSESPGPPVAWGL